MHFYIAYLKIVWYSINRQNEVLGKRDAINYLGDLDVWGQKDADFDWKTLYNWLRKLEKYWKTHVCDL